MVNYFRNLEIKLFCYVVALSDLVHGVDAIYNLRLLLSSDENLSKNLSDDRETAICSFTGISHISEKIFTCC